MSTRLLAGRYELQEKIGDGGMAVVYKARCRLLNRFVAIKILKPEFARNVKFIENFRRESQAAASLNHPNIVNIYDVGREGNVHYIVMELIEGYILSDLISQNGAMEWRRAIEIAKQIASALSFAHKNNIIHRDVKPHNILITRDGTAKITDFGIAKAMDSAVENDGTNTIMGSVHYFSPEQARGGYVDEKSDIYSLGIVLYEMLTGQVPFDGENPVAVALKHINQDILPPRELNEKIPLVVQNVVLKATSKYQIERYASAEEMYNALNDAEFALMMNNSHSKSDSKKDVEIAVSNKRDEDLENSDMKNRGKKIRLNKVKIAAVALALICAIPLSILLSNLLLDGGSSDDEFETPDFRNMTFESAKLAASEYNLEISMGDSVYSSEYDEGIICSQIPDVNSMIKEGKTITVNISKGMKDGTVPNAVGKAQSDARFILEKYGFKVGTVSTAKSNLPKGIVINQSPDAGEEAVPGSYVALTVSEGIAENEVLIPLLLDKTVEEATAELEAVELKIGDISYEMSEAYEKDRIIWQSKEAGGTAVTGTAISVKVSSGAEILAPTIPSIYVDYTNALNDVFWLTVTVSDESGTHNIITRAQRIKSDSGETVYLEGTGSGSVTVIFDNDVVAQYNVDFNTGTVN